MNTKLSDEEFTEVYNKVPRLCVDLVMKNEEGILLALRANEPYKDMWNLPGGTVYKGEIIDEACVRIAKKEIGLDIQLGKCLGYTEYLKEPRFGIEVHTVSIVLEAIAVGGELHHDENTKELRFFKELPLTLV